MERDLRPVEHHQQFGLVGTQAADQPVEGGKAGLALEDAIEAEAQCGLAASRGVVPVGLEVAIEPPDETANRLLGAAMLVGEGVELVNEALGMDSAARMLADLELSGIVADDDGVRDVTMGFEAAPQGAFGSDHHRIGGDRESADAEPIEMGLPRRLVGKMLGLVVGQLPDDGTGQRAAVHVGERFIIDRRAAGRGS